jgi:hypothetical protein
MDDKDGGPLKAEALARDKWRGNDDTFLRQEDAPGHTLPESERDRATDENAGRRSGAVSGTILPPD